MTISFDSIPSVIRVPFVTAEFDSSNSAKGPALLAYKGLLLGQKTPVGTATANTFVLVRSAADAASKFGIGSQLHRMAIAWFTENKAVPCYAAVLDDSTSSALASGSIAVTGTATADGTIALYLGGERVAVAVTSGDSAATIATAIASAIGVHSSGTVTCASAQADDTVTVNGVVFTAVTGAVTLGDAEFSIDTSDTAAAASLAAQVNAHATASQYVRGSSSSGVVTFRAVPGGTAPDAYTLASSNGTRLAVSGATLSGGGVDSVLPVHAYASSSTVTVLARNAGAAANEYNMRANYQDGDAYPSGVSLTITQLTGGTSAPTLTTLIAALGDNWFNVVAHPYTDTTNLTAIENELLDRAGPLRMIDGMAFTAKNDTYANVQTLGAARNSQYSVILRCMADASLTPPNEVAASVAAAVALSAQNDPARPLHNIYLKHIKAPPKADRDTLTEASAIVGSGIATLKANDAGQVYTERIATTYQFNSSNVADTAYQSAEVVLTLAYLRYSWRALIATKYPRHKLADDGTQVGSGQAVMTPKLGKGECLLWFRQMEELGLVENFAQFKQDIVVERNVSDPNRLDFLLPPDLINQFIVAAAKIQFRL